MWLFVTFKKDREPVPVHDNMFNPCLMLNLDVFLHETNTETLGYLNNTFCLKCDQLMAGLLMLVLLWNKLKLRLRYEIHCRVLKKTWIKEKKSSLMLIKWILYRVSTQHIPTPDYQMYYFLIDFISKLLPLLRANKCQLKFE